MNASSFLIPIVTPALLQSEWCCREIALFRQRERETLHRSDLIFPLHYVRVDNLDTRRPEDCHDPEVFKFLRSRQWIDFRHLRLKDPESEEVANQIELLADAICLALRRAEQSGEAGRSGQNASEQILTRIDRDERHRRDAKPEEPFVYIVADTMDRPLAGKLQAAVADNHMAALVMDEDEEGRREEFELALRLASGVIFLHGEARRQFIETWLREFVRKTSLLGIHPTPFLYQAPPEKAVENQPAIPSREVRIEGSQKEFTLEGINRICAMLREP